MGFYGRSDADRDTIHPPAALGCCILIGTNRKILLIGDMTGRWQRLQHCIKGDVNDYIFIYTAQQCNSH